jgi:hypothetical protein
MLQLNTNSAGIGNVTLDMFESQNDEFKKLQLNLIAIHVVSEEYGADTFEKSILRAPNSDLKMRMAKTVMEEYGHHLRFKKILDVRCADRKLGRSGRFSCPRGPRCSSPISSFREIAVRAIPPRLPGNLE